MDLSVVEIFKLVARMVCWGIAIILGVTILLTVTELLLAFASTGIGAIILAVIGYKMYRNYQSDM